MPGPNAIELKLRTRSRLLEVSFEDGARFELPFEYLRVHSPSAEAGGRSFTKRGLAPLITESGP